MRFVICSGQNCNPGQCPVQGSPFITDCFGGLDKYLARYLEMPFLVNETLEPSSNLYDPDLYNPTRYCNELQMCATLKASLIGNAA